MHGMCIMPSGAVAGLWVLLLCIFAFSPFNVQRHEGNDEKKKELHPSVSCLWKQPADSE